MNKIRVIPATFVATLVAMVIAALLLWFWPKYDLSQVHPRLRNLKRPYQYVDTAYFLDGGTVGVGIVDRDGQILRLCFPYGCNSRDETIYDRMLLDTCYPDNPHAVEVPYTDDSKEYVAEIIARYCSGDEAESALLVLRGSPRDYLIIDGKRAMRKLTQSDERYR